MKDYKKVKIAIHINVYEDLILKRQNYFKIVDYLFDNARLSYDKKRLVLNSDLKFMKYFCPMQYNVKLEELKEEEEKKCLKQ